MAGMFYSLEEAAQKLNKSDEEIKELIKAGTLRVFYDGPNPLLKIDEVDALASGVEPVEIEVEQTTADEEFEKGLGITEPELTPTPEEPQELEILPLGEEKEESEISPSQEDKAKEETAGGLEEMAELEIESPME